MKNQEIKASKTTAWQKKLLPFMRNILIGLTVFFLIASFIQLYYLHTQIKSPPDVDIGEKISTFETILKNATVGEQMNYTVWKTLALLEKNAVARRYHQANVLLMSRVWVKYLGFITGMILALVGATFILGKLRESESKLDTTSSLWKFSFTTASPGLLLALLGTILMITTILTHHTIKIKDETLYIPTTIPWVTVIEQTNNGDNGHTAEVEEEDEMWIKKAQQLRKKKIGQNENASENE